MRSQHPFSWNDKVNFAAKTLLDRILSDAPFEELLIVVGEEPNLHLEFTNLMSLWNAVTLETSC